MSKTKFTDYIEKEDDLSFVGHNIDVGIFSLSPLDSGYNYEELANHLRSQYATDDLVKSGAGFFGIKENEYITKYLLPSPKRPKPSPSTASGEFGEIICSDILEKHYFYKIPRLKLLSKQSPDNPVLLTDILGYQDGDDSSKDTLCIAEVKTNLSGNTESTLANAYKEIKKSGKARDKVRLAKTFELYANNALKVKDIATYQKMERFAKKPEEDYNTFYFACSVLNSSTRPSEQDFKISLDDENDDVKMFHVYGSSLKDLEEELFSWFDDDN